MDSITSVQHKNLSGHGKEFRKVLGADEETKSHLYWQIPWNLASLARNDPGITERQHHTDQKQVGLLKEQSAELRKGRLLLYCCNQAWIKNSWLILWNAIAVCDMSKTSWQTRKLPVRKTIWRTMKRVKNSFWSNGRISSDFTARFIKTSSIWQESITWNIPRICGVRREKLERRCHGCRH